MVTQPNIERISSVEEKKIVKFIRTSRPPTGALMNAGDVAGYEPRLAERLVRSGDAAWADVGFGPGTPDPSGEVVHQREVWEKDDDVKWLRRKAQVEAAMKPAEVAKREARAAEELVAARQHNLASELERANRKG